MGISNDIQRNCIELPVPANVTCAAGVVIGWVAGWNRDTEYGTEYGVIASLCICTFDLSLRVGS
jgi:hypothetical protein